MALPFNGSTGINNPNPTQLIPGAGGGKASTFFRDFGASKRNAFTQAGDLQATAATEGAAAEVGGIEKAIAQLQALLGGSFAGVQEASSIGGFGDRLNQIIGGDQFQGLVDERQRGVQGQLAAGGLTRSGTALEAASAVPTDLALGIENQLFGRQAGAFGQEANITQLLAQLLGNQGAVTGEGIRGAAEATAGGILGEKGFQLQAKQAKNENRNQALGLIGTGVGAVFGGPAGAAIGGGIGSAFSDPRLKENVRLEGKIGPLDLVRWDWIPEAKDTIVSQFKTMGFMSTQVKEHFPEFVGEYGGYDVINYSGLMEALEDG
jgi:hypothetical protein